MSNVVFKDNLSPRELERVERLFAADKKQPVTAWLYWLCTGIFGGHRFYLKDPLGAVIILFFQRNDRIFLLLPDKIAGRPSPLLYYRGVPLPAAAH